MFFLFFFLIFLIFISKNVHAKWFKGQLHIHTNKSDGNETPQRVAEIYKELGFDFIVLTDHNISYDPRNEIDSIPDDLLIIQGEEFTYGIPNQFRDIVHVHGNGIGIKETLLFEPKPTVAETFYEIIETTYMKNAIPMINHPNFESAFTDKEILPINLPYLLEIANMHPFSFSEGTMSLPSCELMWDRLLSESRNIFATATDDTHNYKPDEIGKKGFAYPGIGWVVCKADNLDETSILNTFRKGDFYASTGVNIKEYEVSKENIFVSVNSEPDRKYKIIFIGKNGKILEDIIGESGSYIFKNVADEEYVRVKIIDNKGFCAWCQPVFQNGKEIYLSL